MTWRKLLGVLILIITAGLFARYFYSHPELIHQLTQLKLSDIIWPIILYFTSLIPLVFVLTLTLEICGVRLPKKELILVTIYSSIVNFFGPLQSGPVFRAVYLNRRHGVKLKEYALATLLYYAFLAFFSGAFLLLGSRLWWVAALLFVGTGLGIWYLQKKLHKSELQLRFGSVIRLALVTLLQVSIISLIYFDELRLVDRVVHFSQAISYSGAANFSLFVSLTPGAIGIRESFLLLSQHLHGIGSNVVLSASLIDRAVYIIFLGLLFIVALLTHARDKLKLNQVSE